MGLAARPHRNWRGSLGNGPRDALTWKFSRGVAHREDVLERRSVAFEHGRTLNAAAASNQCGILVGIDEAV